MATIEFWTNDETPEFCTLKGTDWSQDPPVITEGQAPMVMLQAMMMGAGRE